MPAKWLNNSGGMPERIALGLERLLHNAAQPEVIRRIRQVLIALFALWAVIALSRFIWALLPGQASDSAGSLPADAVIINPLSEAGPVAKTGGSVVDVQRMMGWHLFGEAGAALAPVDPEPVAATERDGIEKGARETRLELKLRGIVASSEDGLGYAIVEYRSEQNIYAVDDRLPVSGQVLLAKVMPDQVVLDNGGTYELLQLFEDSSLDPQMMSKPVAAQPSRLAAPVVSEPAGADAAALASNYRERLYQDPQSLAEVVTVSAVRENGELLGYRVAPGKDQAQFAQLGFKPGDMVTSVNGIALNDPANTVRLYQAMRSASEAVFDLERDSQQLTITVSLDSGAAEP